MYYLYSHRDTASTGETESVETSVESTPYEGEVSKTAGTKSIQQEPTPGKTQVAVKDGPAVQRIKNGSQRPPNALQYKLDEGIAIVQGDIALGEIVDAEEGATTGFVKMPEIRLWESSIIPIYIQPNLQNPERVIKALEYFNGTAIRFIPYTDQEDVMVFEESGGICKSYVGKIGGKQPLWIAPNCGPDDIAHEIMHALGFVHEQNRTDRDQYITLFPENIDEQYQDNFFRLPESLMTVSGLAAFDYNSLMMYPPTMFSKNGQPTMQSRRSDKDINPTEGLSSGDIDRLHKAYGGR
ncbi:M12 family metallopeptidase [Bdellovibrio sp. HCB337]|uniref:M12 family metallopeptidase n=1 Tax=Bdellovibrio sp. HCB337 TaxID=3394358 RepID=UPI0039A72523